MRYLFFAAAAQEYFGLEILDVIETFTPSSSNTGVFVIRLFFYFLRSKRKAWSLDTACIRVWLYLPTRPPTHTTPGTTSIRPPAHLFMCPPPAYLACCRPCPTYRRVSPPINPTGLPITMPGHRLARKTALLTPVALTLLPVSPIRTARR